MVLSFEKNDITKVKVDAIVNAANNTLLGGGGVDGAIHRAAGPKLLEECRTFGGCETGKAKITKGYDLPAKYVIHTVGPIYQDGKHGEKELLESCYVSCLKLAKENDIHSIAFPLISAGIFGYPKDEAIDVAVDSIKKFFENDNYDIAVKIILFGSESVEIVERKFGMMEKFIACCGLNCEICEARIATINNDNDLRNKVAKEWSELNKVTITPEMINCTGCRVEGAKTPFCESLCPIRKCAKEKNYETCGKCGEQEKCDKIKMIIDNNEEALKNLRKN